MINDTGKLEAADSSSTIVVLSKKKKKKKKTQLIKVVTVVLNYNQSIRRIHKSILIGINEWMNK